ncbi:MAG: RibD family protein [Bdellovibrionota bacterium]
MYIFSNLATSLDGKIATASREHFPLGTPADRALMQVLRLKSDAVLMGASTLRAYRRFCYAKGAKKQPANVVMSATLKGISPEWPFFKSKEDRRILLVGKNVPPARLARFKASCTIIQFSKLSSALASLKKLGINRLLVEGGGAIMWEFVRENLIDDYYVTLTPRLLGGTDAPTLVDGPGFSPASVVNLKLKSVRRKGDELYLVYRKTAKRGP